MTSCRKKIQFVASNTHPCPNSSPFKTWHLEREICSQISPVKTGAGFRPNPELMEEKFYHWPQWEWFQTTQRTLIKDLRQREPRASLLPAHTVPPHKKKQPNDLTVVTHKTSMTQSYFFAALLLWGVSVSSNPHQEIREPAYTDEMLSILITWTILAKS